MPDIHIHRDHKLGLAKARQLALQWAEEAENKLDMACTALEGEKNCTVEFTRMGVKGTLVVEAHQLVVDVKLGFLLSAFSKTIESEIEKNLDDLLSKGSAAARPAAKKAAGKVAKK